MEGKFARTKLRNIPPHPTILKRVVAAVSYAILGSFFTMVSAALIGSLFYRGGNYVAILASYGLGMMQSWGIFGICLALLPLEWRHRTRAVVAIFMSTSLVGAYLSQDWLFRLVQTNEGHPESFHLFSRATVLAVIATAIGGSILSRLTQNFKI